jgi:hypothetical protein
MEAIAGTVVVAEAVREADVAGAADVTAAVGDMAVVTAGADIKLLFPRGEHRSRGLIPGDEFTKELRSVSQLFSFGMFFLVVSRKCPTPIEIAESM